MKKIFILIWLLIMNNMISAQRLLPKQKGIEVNVGKIISRNPENLFVNLGLIVHSKKGNYMRYGLEYCREQITYKVENIAVETITAEAGYSFNLIANRKKSLLFNSTLSGVAGYESVNHGDHVLQDGSLLMNESSFLYGAGGRLSMEIYLSDRFVLIVSGKAKLLWNTSRNLFRPSASVGVRINL